MAKILQLSDKYPLAEIRKRNYVETRITDRGIEYIYHAETYEDLERLKKQVGRG